jgi:predicted nuclease of predicted toxin-antitoxin system
MRLFARLYLDEDVDVLVARLLESRGFSAVTTQEAGYIGQTDRAQLSYAVEHERALLTHNRSDFKALGEQYVHKDRTHYGIILANRRPPHQLTGRLLRLLDHLTAEEMKDQILYI